MNVMTRYSLAERLALTAVKIDLHRLDAIDDLWTAYLDSATPGEVAGQRDELDQLAGQPTQPLVTIRELDDRGQDRLSRLNQSKAQASWTKPS